MKWSSESECCQRASVGLHQVTIHAGFPDYLTVNGTLLLSLPFVTTFTYTVIPALSLLGIFTFSLKGVGGWVCLARYLPKYTRLASPTSRSGEPVANPDPMIFAGSPGLDVRLLILVIVGPVEGGGVHRK